MIVACALAACLVAPPPAEPPATPEPWRSVADCESGRQWGLDVGLFDGGLQFHPDTWAGFAPDHYPDLAHQATRWQQIDVAELVLAEQGWEAWPTCARKLGLIGAHNG